MAAFGDFFKEKRLMAGKTLREFCRDNGFNPGNISKLERNLLSAPQSQNKLEKYASTLEIKKGTDDWLEFFDLAAISAGRIPADISDSELINEVPILFRAIRNNEIEENEELKKLINAIRKELR